MSWRTEISTVFFDFGDTLWYFPEPTPLETVMQETRARVASALHDQGHESHQAAPAFGPAAASDDSGGGAGGRSG